MAAALIGSCQVLARDVTDGAFDFKAHFLVVRLSIMVVRRLF
ncbi:hypothetical protein [Pseudoalteromonas luteoviolacea]|uniref:Uncharacterized protein n=1 Tax=Pseudoalteromonas luteoviolacea S4060-1 TaxID=1365257 RepID=A0A162C3B3_9GAMM|nr:hypothetical protein [Pseudoalteromonas luteoviolacea]KZN61484.1 hypothetical protein N478_05275 [Pseudoalteromonas luteoviolacea S4060-1]